MEEHILDQPFREYTQARTEHTALEKSYFSNWQDYNKVIKTIPLMTINAKVWIYTTKICHLMKFGTYTGRSYSLILLIQKRQPATGRNGVTAIPYFRYPEFTQYFRQQTAGVV